MIISIAGKEGSGKSTVAKILEKKLKLKRYYMGGIRRELARKKGMTLEEYNKLGETDPTTDTDVDGYQKKLGETRKNFIIEGRTSFHFIPHSYKIFLEVDDKEAAKRIYHDLKNNPGKRNEGNPKTIKDVMDSIKKRRISDIKRYKKYYNINHIDKKNFDLIIDTTNITPDEVVKTIMASIKNIK